MYTRNTLKNPHIIGIVLLTVLGLILRLYHLDFNCIWGDELYTLMFSSTSLMNIWSSFMTDCHPPLFYWIEHFILLIGNDENFLRIIPAIFGTLSIPTIYFAFREVFNENISFISALLLAVSPFHIYYSQEARMYTMWLFLFLISLYYFFKFIETPSKIGALKFGIMSGIAFWVHFYTGLFFSLLILYAIITNRAKISNFMTHVAYSIIGFIVIILPLLPSISTILTAWPNEQKWFGYMGIYVIPGALYEFFGSNTTLAICSVVLLIVGLTLMLKNGRENLIFVVFMISTCLVSAVVLSYKLPMVARYLFPLYALILIPISVSISRLFDFFEKKKVYTGSLVLIATLLVFAPAIGNYYEYPSKEDHRMEAREISNITNDGDYFVLLTNGRVFQHYYNNETDGVLIFTCQTYSDLSTLNKTRGEHRMIIMPQFDPNGYEKELEWINSNYNDVKTLENNAKVYIID